MTSWGTDPSRILAWNPKGARPCGASCGYRGQGKRLFRLCLANLRGPTAVATGEARTSPWPNPSPGPRAIVRASTWVGSAGAILRRSPAGNAAHSAFAHREPLPAQNGPDGPSPPGGALLPQPLQPDEEPRFSPHPLGREGQGFPGGEVLLGPSPATALGSGLVPWRPLPRRGHVHLDGPPYGRQGPTLAAGGARWNRAHYRYSTRGSGLSRPRPGEGDPQGPRGAPANS